MKTVYLSLGSNIGERERNLCCAVAALLARGVHIVRHSSLYSTEPVDLRTQSWFLNCVAQAETSLMPHQLLRAVQEIEFEFGRRRLVRRGPRVVDIDILLYGLSIVESPDLQIPHPRMAQRRFVLVPLAEIAPALRHPTLKKTMRELLADTTDRSQVRRRNSSIAP